MKKHQPRKRFGQHFLADPGVIGDIVAAIHPAADDTIVEIGPGLGAMTTPLAASGCRLHAVELDRDLAATLQTRFAGSERVTIHEADALAFDFASLGRNLRIVGNLPYNISTPLLFHLLRYRAAIVDMHFMLQKEVVDRIVAQPGSKAYGRLGIMLGCYLASEALFDVGPAAFDPPPEVVSAVVRLDPLPPGTYEILSDAALSSLVATAFMQRRKTLRNALRKVANDEDFAAVDIDPGQRPEQIPVDAYVRLANRLHRKSR